MKRSLISASLLALVLFLPGLLQAQPFTIDWFTIAGGGGTSSGGSYTLSGTIGQADAGNMSGGNYSITGGFWSLTATVPVVGSPAINVTQTGGSVVLSWSTSATGFLLESSVNLAVPGGWSTISTIPTVVNGTNYVTNSITAGNRFYRLRHP